MKFKDVTIDAYDTSQKKQEIIGKITIWKDYDDRSKGKVGRLKHGTRVRLLSHTTPIVKIRFGFWRRTGFVSFWFIREFKDG